MRERIYSGAAERTEQLPGLRIDYVSLAASDNQCVVVIGVSNHEIVLGQTSNKVARPARCAAGFEAYDETLGLRPSARDADGARGIPIGRKSRQHTEFKSRRGSNSIK
jgi:hypothetical protein